MKKNEVIEFFGSLLETVDNASEQVAFRRVREANDAINKASSAIGAGRSMLTDEQGEAVRELAVREGRRALSAALFNASEQRKAIASLEARLALLENAESKRNAQQYADRQDRESRERQKALAKIRLDLEE